MARYALVQHKRSRQRIRVRKNFLPLIPLAVPVLLGGVSIAAIALAMRKTADKAKAFVSMPAVVGAGVGYIAARAYKQDAKMQAAATISGYAAGMWLNNYLYKAELEKAKEEYEANYRWYNPLTWASA